MKIALGSDHRGHEVRSHLAQILKTQDHQVHEMGPRTRRACDYPDAAFAVANSVAQGDHERGILICGSGIGMCICANKVVGIRAALVHDEIGADMSRRHNDSNVLCLSADMLGERIIDRLVQTWLQTEFDGGRHARRVAKIEQFEQGLDHQAADNRTALTE